MTKQNPSQKSGQGWKSNNSIELVVAILATLGANKAITDSTDNVWVIIGLSALAFVVGFVLARFTNLANWLGEKIDTWLQDRIGGTVYKKKYLEHLIYRHRNFDVKGLTTQGVITLELLQVFVDLSIVPQPAHLTSKNPLQLPIELKEGKHAIWDYLKVKADQDFAVIGPPGSGKTTLLKHMALLLAGPKETRQKYELEARIPILLFLRNHAESIAKETDADPYTMEEAIELDLKKWEKSAPEGLFTRWLGAGQCQVLLDGLDEVADPKVRRKVVGWVERQMQIFHRCQFVVTSRPYGYRSNPLSGVTVLEVRPFDSAQQHTFVHNWYRANEIKSQQRDDEGVRMDAQEGAEDLLRRLGKSPRLVELAVNPLLLTMIATVHKYRGSLPVGRVELYAEICTVFLGKRQQSKELELDLSPTQRQRILQPLAWHMMVKKKREIEKREAIRMIRDTLFVVKPDLKPEQFLQQIENESGLFLERESDEYAFAHLTFQEYLAAVHATKQQLVDKLVAYVTENWWRETILLYVAGADATPLVAACLPEEGLPTIDALLLAGMAMEEAQELDGDVRQRVQSFLDNALESEDVEQRKLVAEFTLRRRLRNMVRLSETTFVSTSFITHAEYQLFLDEMYEQGVYHYPDHWTELQFPAGQGHLPAVGMRYSDAQAFADWLTQRLGGDWPYRLPQTTELEGVQLNIPEVTERIGFWRITQADQGRIAMVRDMVNKVRFHSLDRDLDLERASALDLECSLVLARDLARALNRASDLDLERASALASALKRALDLARDRDRDNALVIDHARDRASALKRALDLARDRDLDRDRALDRDICPVIEVGNGLVF